MTALEQRTDHASLGLSRLISQYQDQPKIAGLIESYLNRIQEAEDANYSRRFALDIDNAAGYQLDVLGRILETPREGRLDPEYKPWLKAKIPLNRSSGKVEQILEILAAILPAGTTLTYREHPPASFTIEADGAPISTQLGSAAAEIVRRAKLGGKAGAFLWPRDNTTALRMDPSGGPAVFAPQGLGSGEFGGRSAGKWPLRDTTQSVVAQIPTLSGVPMYQRVVTASAPSVTFPTWRWWYGDDTAVSGATSATLVCDIKAEKLGVYVDVSADGGATWTRSATGLKAAHPQDWADVVLRLDPRDPTTFTGDPLTSLADADGGASANAFGVYGTVPSGDRFIVPQTPSAGGSSSGAYWNTKFGLLASGDWNISICGNQTPGSSGDRIMGLFMDSVFTGGSLGVFAGGVAFGLRHGGVGNMTFVAGADLVNDNVISISHDVGATMNNCRGRAFGAAASVSGSPPTGAMSDAGTARCWFGTERDQRGWSYASVILSNSSLLANVERIEGWQAWAAGIEGSMNAAHPYKSAPPSDTLMPPFAGQVI